MALVPDAGLSNQDGPAENTSEEPPPGCEEAMDLSCGGNADKNANCANGDGPDKGKNDTDVQRPQESPIDLTEDAESRDSREGSSDSPVVVAEVKSPEKGKRKRTGSSENPLVIEGEKNAKNMKKAKPREGTAKKPLVIADEKMSHKRKTDNGSSSNPLVIDVDKKSPDESKDSPSKAAPNNDDKNKSSEPGGDKNLNGRATDGEPAKKATTGRPVIRNTRNKTPKSCCVPGCTSRRNRVPDWVKFYRLPQNDVRFQQWLEAIPRDWWSQFENPLRDVNRSMFHVCSMHFEGGVKSDYVDDTAYIPTLFNENINTKRPSAEPDIMIVEKPQVAPKTKAGKNQTSPEPEVKILQVDATRKKTTIVTATNTQKPPTGANVFVIQPHQVTPVVLAPDHRPEVKIFHSPKSNLLKTSILKKKKPKDSSPSVTYNLNWPGFGFMPMYIVDKIHKKLYHEGHPLPRELLYLDAFQNKYVAVDDVLSCFKGQSLAQAAKQLILLTENIETTASYRHDATREYFIQLNTLLAFIIIAPYCPEFQHARSAILTHLMDYAEMPCLKCGFVQRDCWCNMQPDVLVKHHGPTELVAKVTDLTESSTQTDVVSCPICKDPQAFKTAKNPMLVMPPGLKLNPGEKFSLTMQQNSSGAVQIRAGMCPDDGSMDTPVPNLSMGMAGSPAGMLPLGMLPPGPPMSSPSDLLPPSSVATSLPHMPSSMPPPLPPCSMAMPPSSLPPASLNLPGMVPWLAPHSAASHPPQHMMWPPLPSSMEPPPNLPPGGFSFPRLVLPPSPNAPPSRLSSLHPLMPEILARQQKNQPHYITSKPMLLRDPKDILREEDIRRKKRRMDKLFDDKFQLAKPPSEDAEEKSVEGEKSEEQLDQVVTEKSSPVATPATEHKMDTSPEKVQKSSVDGEERSEKPSDKKRETKDGKEDDNHPEKEGDVGKIAEESINDAKKGTGETELPVVSDHTSPEVKPVKDGKNPEEHESPKAEVTEQVKEQQGLDNDGVTMETGDQTGNKKQEETGKHAEHIVDLTQDSAVVKLNDNVMGGALDMLASVAEVLNDKLDTKAVEKEIEKKKEEELNDNASTRPASPESDSRLEGLEMGEDLAETQSLLSENSLISELSRDIEAVTGKSLADIPVEPSPTKDEDKAKTDNNKDSPDTPKESPVAGQTSPATTGPPTPASTPATPSTPAEGGEAPFPTVLPDLSPEAIEKGFADFEYVPTGERMIRCVLFGCGQCFDTEDCARLHVRCHEPRGKGLVCFVCKDFTVQSIKWYNMERHLQEKHGEGKPVSELHCRFCGLLFDSAEDLEKHVAFHYYSEYKCIHCSQHCFTWKHMQHHLTSCADVSKQFYYNCPYCHLVFHTAPIQQMHINSHTDKGFMCCICKDETVWETWKKLKTHYYKFHLSRDQKKFVKCTKCRRTFATMVTYNTHMEKYHSGKKKLQKEDDKDFEPSAKKRKMSVSSETVEEKREEKEGEEEKEDKETKEEEGPDEQSEEEEKKEDDRPPPEFECEKCGKKFREQRRLDLHLENAHGEVQCDQCDHVAKNKYLLKSHIAQRHAEKQHTCTECGKAFARFFQLKIHLAAHARKAMYPCKVCKAEFHSHREMRQHFNQSHAINNADRAQLTCDNCDFRCYSRTTMKLHLRKKHPEENDDDDGVDHSYFTKNLMAPPPPPSVSRRSKKDSVLSLPRGRGRGRGRGGRRGGRGRSAKYLAREESRRKEQVKSDNILRKKIKRLRKNSCSRTRSLDENRLIKLDDAKNGEQNMTIDEERDPLAESASSADPFSDIDRSGPLSPQYAANAPWDSPPSQAQPAVSPKYSYSSRGRRRTISRPRSPYDTIEWGRSKSHEDIMLSPEPGPSTLDMSFGLVAPAEVAVPPPPPPPPPQRTYLVQTVAGVVDLRVIELDHCYCTPTEQPAVPPIGLPDDGIDVMDTFDDIGGPPGLAIPEQHAIKPSVYSSMTGVEALFLPPQKTVATRVQADLISPELGSSTSTLVNPEFRGMKATISSGLATKRIIPSTSTPNIIGIHKLPTNTNKPSIVSIRKVITAKDLEGQKRVVMQSLPQHYEKVTVRSIPEPQPPVLAETIPQMITHTSQPVAHSSMADPNYSQSVNLSKLVAALSEGEQSGDLPVVPDDDPNMSGGSNVSLGDLDSNLLMPDADMQDILQAAVQVLQDREIMESVENIPQP